MKQPINDDSKVIAMDTIRLSADETRALVRAANAKGAPITHHCACTLEGLGLMQTKTVPGVDQSKEIQNC